MPTAQARLYLHCANPPLSTEVVGELKKLNLKVDLKNAEGLDYRLFIFEPLSPVDNFIADSLALLGGTVSPNTKDCVVLVFPGHASESEMEKAFSLFRPYLNNPDHNLRLIQAFDLYGHNSPAPVGEFQSQLCQAIQEKKMAADSSDTNFYFPTSTTDLCGLVLKSLFISNTSGEVFTAASEKISELELAYLLKKSLDRKDVSLELSLIHRKTIESPPHYENSVQTQALLNWFPKDNLADNINLLVDNCLQKNDEIEILPEELGPDREKPTSDLPKLKPLEEVVHSKVKVIKNPFGFLAKLKLRPQETLEINLHRAESRGAVRLFLWLSLLVISLAVLPLILGLGSLYLSSRQTLATYKEIRLGREKQARQNLNTAIAWRQFSVVALAPGRGLLNLITPTNSQVINNYQLLLAHGQNLLDLVMNDYSLANSLYLGLLGKQTVESQSLIAAIRLNLINLSSDLSQIQLLLNKNSLPFGLGKNISDSELQSQISLLKNQIELSLPVLDLVDRIVTNQKLQHYLVIVQDENELRPTGGFLTSYAMVTVNDGKVIDITANSSLVVDRLIEGRLDALGIVSQLTGQKNWTFHDSNLDADFGRSATQMSWFWTRFQNASVDGVIGLNLSYYKNLLTLLGPVTLADGQKIDSDNLALLASNPTSSRGLDVITALTQVLAKRLLAGDINFAVFSRSLLQTISANETTLWFSDPAKQSLIAATDLSGIPAVQPCHPQLAVVGCSADTVYVNEANMSIAKINYYLKRSQDYLIRINTDGTVDYTLTLDYSYPVPAPTNLTRDYKAYYQVYLPLSATNLSVTLDRQSLDPKSIIKTQAGQLQKLEFSASLALNQNHQLVFGFKSSNVLNLNRPQTAFTLAYRKQPGTLNDHLTFKILYPAEIQAKTLTLPLLQTGPQELSYRLNQTTDLDIGILFKNLAF